MAAPTKSKVAQAQGPKRRYHEVFESEAKDAGKPASGKTSKSSKTGAKKSEDGVKKPSKKVTIAEAPASQSESDKQDSDVDAAAVQASTSVRKNLAKKGVDLNPSDSESGEDDDAEVNRNAPIVDIVRIPSSKDDATVKARLDAVNKRRAERKGKNTNAGVIYVGRIPRGFYEPQMRAYFGQFGKITHLRLSRNPKTGAPRHYGFIEFDDVEVAKIVAETMDNYLIMGHLMQVKVIPQDEVHPDLFKGSHRRFVGKSSREVEDARAQREHELHDRARTTEEQKSVNDALLKRQEKRRETLKNKGFDYDFPGYQVS